MQRGQGSYAFDIPLDVAGTIQLQAYAILENADIARDTKLIQVHRADQLQVQAVLDAETYQPAEKAMIEFLVTSKDGTPVEAALSLAAVDEAVFALNDSRPGLEEMYFLIQEEILKPRAQLVAQPPSDFSAIPNPDDPKPELEEANVVAFAAAAETEGPSSSKSSSQAERRRELDGLRREHADGLSRLLVTFPFGLLVFCSLVFAGYGFSRFRFHAGNSEELHIIEFRRRMRQFFWIILTATVAPPVLMIGMGLVTDFLSAPVAFVIWVVLMISGTVWLGIKSAELRRLNHSKTHLSLFRQMVGLVPIVYGLFGLTVMGMVVLSETNHSAINDSSSWIYVVSPLFILFLLAGLIGFLRRTLSASQTLPKRIGVLALNLAIVLVPVLLAGLAYPASVRIRASVEQFDVAALEMVIPTAAASAGLERAEEDGSTMIGHGGRDSGGAEPPRIRRHFPETLLWQPQLITDPNGKASLEVNLADSITTWRLSGSAVSRSGLLGSFEDGIRVFQDFFIDIDFPTELTQGDEVTVPIAVFNYLTEPQSIRLNAQPADWYELVSDVPEKTVDASAGGVLQASYRIRAIKPGRHALTVFAEGSKLADAVERRVRVVPDGKRVEVVANGQLIQDSSEQILIPDHAVPGGSDLFVKIYPGAFSQVVEGMDSIFRMPYGCFEQTSSTTYPNVLVLNYLRETKQAKPELEMKALDFIAQGYQRLLSYEVDGGGFDWFGNPPAHNILTAYGLMEFVDMAKVYEVDPSVIERTKRWLLKGRKSDGRWEPVLGGIAEGAINSFQGSRDLAVLRSTAYIALAIAEAGGKEELESSFDFLAERSDGIEDTYTLALIANAFVAAERNAEAREVLRQLDTAKMAEGASVFWKADGEGLTYGRGDSFHIETTALVVQAMLRARVSIGTAHKALAWLISKRDGQGTWHSTQATVQAMRALLMGAGSAGEVKGKLEVEIVANGDATNSLEITKQNADVFHLISLTEFVRPGANEVRLSTDRETNLAYQMVAVYYESHTEDEQKATQILEIETDYETTELASRDLLKVDVTLRYNRPGFAPMTLVDLGLPPGFEMEVTSFEVLLKNKVIQRFEPKGRQVTLYFDAIPGDGKPLQFRYQLRAKFPVKAQAPASVAYQYYEPEVRAETKPVLLEVR
ncbi:MAG: alpha-2-macroglobulin family protein [Verrucomicrobiota bacterium]